MATADAVGDSSPTVGRVDRTSAWARWWLAGTPLDWGYVALSGLLITAGYYDAWSIRHQPVNTWEHALPQAAWAAVTIYLATWTFVRWRRGRSLESVVPENYGTAAVGCIVFLAGILINTWWTTAFGLDSGVPAIFRPPNLLQIGGAALIVSGPLRASVGRGELMAGPTAVLSAVLLLAAVTFFTQFDHPYIDDWAKGAKAPPFPMDFMAEELGALSLMMQTAAVTGVTLWTLRQTKLPIGSITLMVTMAGLAGATQLGHFQYVVVALGAGIASELALILTRPRADRDHSMRLFAVCVGALLSGLFLGDVAVGPGTWWPADMICGSIVACALVGGLMSYVIFPGSDALRAASVLWPVQNQDSSPTAPDVTVERVEHALKVLHSTRDLAENPLIGLHSLASPTAASLRQTIEAAIDHLRSSSFQPDAQAGEILNLYYVRRIGGHYAVTLRVGLSRAGYFNRRSYGVRRVVDRLRELEESATPAA
jgi:hypothetical protein